MMKAFLNGTSLIPQRYIIASLFIAAMLLLFAVVQAGRPVSAGGVATAEAPAVMNLGGYELLAELRLEDGWSPRTGELRTVGQRRSACWGLRGWIAWKKRPARRR